MSLRRLKILRFLMILTAGLVLCRVLWIGTDQIYAVSAGRQTAKITELPRERGNFYDRKGRLLTGYTREWYALCIPGDASYATLFPYVPTRSRWNSMKTAMLPARSWFPWNRT